MADNFTNNNYIQAPLVLPVGGPGPCLQRLPHSAGGYSSSHSSIGEDRMHHLPNLLPTSVNCCLSTDYSNPHSGMNYNHLPYSSGITSSVMTTLSSVASVSSGLCVTAPGSFTFTSPARLLNICSAPSQTNLYGHFTPAPAPQTFAPGLGASWQHAVPSQMPWTESGSTAVPPIFTGSMGYNYSENACLNQWSTTMEPVPSCSTPPRRPKRTAVNDGCEIPNKLHISEEKMTASMQDLSLCNHGYEDMMNRDDDMEGSFPTSTQATINESWKKFKELEKMLCGKPTTSGTSSTGVKLHLNPSVAQQILSTEILPKDVLKTISKPCMQIVLWKPPAEKFREVVSGNVSKSRWKDGKASPSSGSRSVLSQSQTSSTCSPALRTPITSTAIPIRRQPMIVIADVDDDTAMEL